MLSFYQQQSYFSQIVSEKAKILTLFWLLVFLFYVIGFSLTNGFDKSIKIFETNCTYVCNVQFLSKTKFEHFLIKFFYWFVMPFHKFCYSLSFLLFVYISCYFIYSYFLLFLSSRLLFLPTNIQDRDDGPNCITRSSHSGPSSYSGPDHHSGESCKLSNLFF